MVNENDLSRRDFVDGLDSLRKEIRHELDEFRRSLECTRGRQTPPEQRAGSELPCNQLRNEIAKLRQTTTSSNQKNNISKALIVILLIVVTLAGWLYPNLFPPKELAKIQGLVSSLNSDIKLVTDTKTPNKAQPPAPDYPTWREEKYTVLRPVYETVMKDEKYTVMRPIEETTYEEEKYTERVPVKETVMREEKFKVQKPVYETEEREKRVTVRKPVYETGYVDQQVTVNEPVTSWIPVCEMIYDQPVWTNVPVTAIVSRTVVQKVPVRTVRYKDVVEVRKVPEQTVRYVEEEEVREVPVETVRYVEEEKVRKVPVTKTRMVEEEKVRQVPVTTVRNVEEERVRLVPVPAGELPVTNRKKAAATEPK